MPAPQDQASARSEEGAASWRWAFLFSDAIWAVLILGGGTLLAIRWLT
jgi:hypothetical protein